MTYIRIKLLMFLTLGLSGSLLAKPIGYARSWGIMGFNQSDTIEWQVNYAPTYYFGIGLDYSRDTMMGSERQFVIPRADLLLKRWNGEDSQGNIYIGAGAGIGRQNGLTRPTFLGSIEADWETRAIYFAGKAATVLIKDIDGMTYYQLRAGFAPYLAEFNELNSWIILQAQYYPNAVENNFRIGPVLRFFYSNVLWEIGVTQKGMWQFNFMIHFY